MLEVRFKNLFARYLRTVFVAKILDSKNRSLVGLSYTKSGDSSPQDLSVCGSVTTGVIRNVRK